LVGLAAGLLAAGCAGMSEADCRGADWYSVGYRDAIFGLQRQDGAYAQQCERYGAKVDSERYAQGWREGKYAADDRKL
jgi:hypothetical protein